MDDINIELRQKYSRLADVIRSKTGKTNDIAISEMSQEINSIKIIKNYARYEVDENGNLITRTKPLNFDDVKNVGDYGMSYCFKDCSKLSSVSFPILNSIGSNGMYYCFQSCSNLSSISFPSLTSIGSNGMYYCFQNCSKLKEIHFKSSAQSVVEASEGYSSKFGASNATIYFDL